MQRPPGGPEQAVANPVIGSADLGEAAADLEPSTTAAPVETAPPVEANSGPIIGIPARPRESKPAEKRSALELTVDAPAEARVGDEVVFRVRLRNIGTKPLDAVGIECQLEPALASPGRKSRRIGQEFGELEPNAEHETELVVVAEREGRHCCEFTVKAGGVEEVWKSVCIEFSAAK